MRVDNLFILKVGILILGVTLAHADELKQEPFNDIAGNKVFDIKIEKGTDNGTLAFDSGE